MCEVLSNHYLANTYDIPRSFSLLSIHDADDDSKTSQILSLLS